MLLINLNDLFLRFLPPSTALRSFSAELPRATAQSVDVEVERDEAEERREEEEAEGEEVQLEKEEEEEGRHAEGPIGVVDPDRMLREDERKRAEEKAEAEEGEDDEGEEEPEEKKKDEGQEPTRVRQLDGTMAVALPAEHIQPLGRLNLEVQVRPRFPNGVILYAAGADSARRPKQKPPFLHSLELANGTVQYIFRLGGEQFEVQSREPIKLDEWNVIRVINDGKNRASLKVGSAPPTELSFTRARLRAPPANVPSRVFLGGPDPARVRHMPRTRSTNFVGAIGRLMMNGREVEVVEAETRQGTEGQYPRVGEEGAEARLEQSENQCSREPCRNGGQCRLTRWGGFECHCAHGFAGHLCQLPSTDGICPEGRRWCLRGICSLPEAAVGNSRRGHQEPQHAAQCLCPPGWTGSRCEQEMELDPGARGIRMDGANSFLALPLGIGVEEGGQEGPSIYSIELRLSPDPERRGTNRQQLIGMMIGAQGTVISALGMQGEKFWAVQQEGDDQPATKRLLTKRIKYKKTHRLRLEQGDAARPGEMRVLVEGVPKGVLRGEPSAEGRGGMLVLGGVPPRGPSVPRAMAPLISEVPPFAGCVEELRLNGRLLGMEELKRDGYAGAGLESCAPTPPMEQPQAKTIAMETTTSPPATITSNITPWNPASTTPLPIFTVSQDPVLLAGQRGVDNNHVLGPFGVMEAEEKEEDQQLPPNTVSSDQLPHESTRTTAVPAPPIILTTTTTSPTPDPTTAMPAPPRPLFRHRPDPFVPPTSVPDPGSAELEVPFAGLCDANTCSLHGSCEDINRTHVICACRDYYVGQRCEEFRPIEYAAKFDGSAFVVFSSDEFPHLSSEREEVVEFKLRTRAKYGLIMWQGQHPESMAEEGHAQETAEQNILMGEDFLSIGLLDGFLSFSYELGGGAAQLLSEVPVDDGRTHAVRAVRRGRDGWLFVDNEQPVTGRSSGILAMLNVEGHIFVGGVPDLHQMTAGLHTQNLVGCVAELALNGQKMDLMGSAIDGRNVKPCRSWEPSRMRRRRKWMKMMRKQRKAASEEQRRRKKKELSDQ